MARPAPSAVGSVNQILVIQPIAGLFGPLISGQHGRAQGYRGAGAATTAA